MDIVPLSHKFAHGPQTVVEGQGRFTQTTMGIQPVHGLSQFRACHNTVCFCLEIYPAIYKLSACDISLNLHLIDRYLCSSSLFSVI